MRRSPLGATTQGGRSQRPARSYDMSMATTSRLHERRLRRDDLPGAVLDDVPGLHELYHRELVPDPRGDRISDSAALANALAAFVRDRAEAWGGGADVSRALQLLEAMAASRDKAVVDVAAAVLLRLRGATPGALQRFGSAMGASTRRLLERVEAFAGSRSDIRDEVVILRPGNLNVAQAVIAFTLLIGWAAWLAFSGGLVETVFVTGIVMLHTLGFLRARRIRLEADDVKCELHNLFSSETVRWANVRRFSLSARARHAVVELDDGRQVPVHAASVARGTFSLPIDWPGVPASRSLRAHGLDQVTALNDFARSARTSHDMAILAWRWDREREKPFGSKVWHWFAIAFIVLATAFVMYALAVEARNDALRDRLNAPGAVPSPPPPDLPREPTYLYSAFQNNARTGLAGDIVVWRSCRPELVEPCTNGAFPLAAEIIVMNRKGEEIARASNLKAKTGDWGPSPGRFFVPLKPGRYVIRISEFPWDARIRPKNLDHDPRAWCPEFDAEIYDRTERFVDVYCVSIYPPME